MAKLVLGVNPKGDSNATPEGNDFKGYIYAFRFYEDTLKKEELERNWAIDEGRFRLRYE